MVVQVVVVVLQQTIEIEIIIENNNKDTNQSCRAQS